MKTSELIKELEEAMKWNGDQDICVMIYGKQFNDIELNAEDKLYIEAYLHNENDEDLFLRQYVIRNSIWII